MCRRRLTAHGVCLLLSGVCPPLPADGLADHRPPHRVPLDREEHQYPDGEAKRNDEEFSYIAGWQHQGEGRPPLLHKEPLTWETVKPSVRVYK